MYGVDAGIFTFSKELLPNSAWKWGLKSLQILKQTFPAAVHSILVCIFCLVESFSFSDLVIWRYDLLDSKLGFCIKLLWSFKVLLVHLIYIISDDRIFFKIFLSSLKPNLNPLYMIYHCIWLSSLILYS